MALYRCMALLEPTNLASEDYIVNTIHVLNDTDTLDFVGDELWSAMANFYNALSPALSGFLSGKFTTKVYNMADTPPRVPAVNYGDWGGNPGSATYGNLPNECCAVLTLEGAPPITPRRRGRMYIGPLNGSSIDMPLGTTPEDARFKAQFRTDVTNAAIAFNNGLQRSVWVIAGKSGPVSVMSGWVDDAIDIQRRRGQAPTERTSFTF